ncbi:MAG: hypothetical protein M3162_08510 [Thermoproteota archaeon]|nr:hypothetical protein [Thermoproteota archaeon]
MLVAESFCQAWSRLLENISFLLMMVEPVSSGFRFLKLGRHLHSPGKKSTIERSIQYIKDRTESFDHFPYRKEHCNLNHVNTGSTCLQITITKN